MRYLLIFIILSSLFLRCSNSTFEKCSYEVLSNYRIGKFQGFNDFPKTKFYYKVILFNDSTFEYISYNKVPFTNVLNRNVDSLIVKGKFKLTKKRIEFIHNRYFKDSRGIIWILKNNSIIVRGYNTRRVKLLRIYDETTDN
jgi:hypothetical protein